MDLGKKWTLAKQWLNEKSGNTKPTVDHEFEMLWQKQDSLQETTRATIKHLNLTIENIHAFQSNLAFLSEDFMRVYDKDEPQREVPQSMEGVAESIQKNCCVPYQNNLTAGIQKLMEYQVKFDNLTELKNLREERRKEYDYRRAKVESLTEKPSKDPLALPKEKEKLAEAKADYETINEEAKAQIEELFVEKHEAFDTVLPIVIRETLDYQKKVLDNLGKLDKYSNMKPTVTSKPKRQPVQKKELVQKEEPVKKSGPTLPSRNKSVVDTIPPKFDVEWFYLDEAMEQKGPVGYKELKGLFKKGKLNPDSYVFEANMSDWGQIGALSELHMNLKK